MSTATDVREANEGAEKPLGGRFVGGVANYLDERTSMSGFVKELGRKIFPDHWSFMLGEIALWSFVVVFISGTFLTFFFQASMVPTHYTGAYLPMRGVEMSAAFESALRISFDIRGGLLVRQIHHWAALVFIAGIGVHMLRVFFTGAFRKPRELNWVIGYLLFILALAEGFTGYSLPDDLLSGNGLRIIDGMVKGIPIIGTWTSYLVFGGEFPGSDIVGRLYTLHILLLPLLVIAFVALHLMLMVINKHTQFAGPGRTNDNVVGYPMMPVYMSKMGGYLFIVFGTIVLIATFFQILPFWEYGPYDPAPISAGTQPDWYIGFADGALRLAPSNWDIVFLNRTWSFGIIVPVLILVLFLVAVAIYPFLEAWVTGDKREHHIAQRPRNAATRTAIGAAGVVFYAVLWAAASSDLIATHFMLTMEGVILSLQILLFLGPVLAYFVTKRICIALQKKDREIVLHGYESGRIVRLAGGEYIEVHQPVNVYDRWKLLDNEQYEPLVVRPNEKGRIPWTQNVRASFSRWFYEDRLVPLTQADIDEADAHHHHAVEHVDETTLPREVVEQHRAAAQISEETVSRIDDATVPREVVQQNRFLMAEAKPSVDEARSRMAAIAERTSAGHQVATDDDLKLVHGIGPKISDLLHSLGITSFEQIARFTVEDIQTVSTALETFPDRIERDDWMSSARELHREHHGEDPLA